MDIQTRKIEFVQAFLKIQSEEMISQFEKLLNSAHKSNIEREFNPMSIAELNNRIDKSLQDSENNRLTSSSDLIAEIEKWG